MHSCNNGIGPIMPAEVEQEPLSLPTSKKVNILQELFPRESKRAIRRALKECGFDCDAAFEMIDADYVDTDVEIDSICSASSYSHESSIEFDVKSHRRRIADGRHRRS